LVATLRRAWERADVIIMTGGLGPTEDDVTREAIAELVGETPQIDEAYLSGLRAWFAKRGVAMPARNAKQAWIISSATALANPIGTAPGWFVEKDGHIIIAMPGVPREMKKMWAEQATPRLQAKTGATLFTRTLRVYGLGESTVEERLGDLIHQMNPTVATYAKSDAVDVRISAKASTTAEAEDLVQATAAHARHVLGKYVFGVDRETLASVISKLLLARGWHIAAMESCTGGLLMSYLTDVPGSSDSVWGGIVTYATELKIAQGVPADIIEQYGVVSDATALAMARAIRHNLSVEVGVGITGVAGPEPQDDKPVGEVHIGIALPTGETVTQVNLWGERAEIKHRAALTALNLLRLQLLGEE
jgi:nicotinamide-nucleotide amidase